MKGIILAGGSGSRLYPITHAVSKQLLPIYNKPMIFYPLSVLMLSGIRDILLITTPNDLDSFKRLLGNGNQYGINLNYEVQRNPEGIAQAFLIGKNFIGSSKVCLILGDNIFYGQSFTPTLKKASKLNSGALLFGYAVNDPSRFGIIEFDDKMQVVSIEEKPKIPKSNFAATGLYFYDNNVIEIAKSIKSSNRGELEITSLNKIYLKQGNLKVELLGRGFAWLDTGTYENLLAASQFVETIEKRQGFKIACLEEIAWRNGWLTDEDLLKKSEIMKNNDYGQYLKSIININKD